jgi:hypothetical protein
MVTTLLVLAFAELMQSVMPTVAEPSSSWDASATICPADKATARGIVERFLTSPNTFAMRQERGMGSVRIANLRVLTDAQDAAICQEFNASIKLDGGRYPRTATYYYADGFYFVPTTWVDPPGSIYLTFAPLLVFDAQRNFVEAFAM